MKRINIENDVASRRRIAEGFPKPEVFKESIVKEVEHAQSKEVPEHPVVESTAGAEGAKKGRRKTERNA